MGSAGGAALGAFLFCCVLGVAAVAGGLYLMVRSRFLETRCTARAAGVIVDIVDEGFKESPRKAARRSKEADEQVVAANEAIAAKKRAYNARRRVEARAEAQAAASTWRPVVRYQAGGASFDARATRGVSKGRYKVGQPCEVHYDPSRPARRWLAIDGLPGTFGVMICLCGVALVGVGVACWFLLPAIADLSSAAVS